MLATRKGSVCLSGWKKSTRRLRPAVTMAAYAHGGGRLPSQWNAPPIAPTNAPAHKKRHHSSLPFWNQSTWGGAASNTRLHASSRDDSDARLRALLNDSDEKAARAGGGGGGRRINGPSYNGVFALLAINFVLFALDHLFHQNWVKWLYLNHQRPVWFQFVTSTFCHANYAHLSSNAFFLYIFGKLVEEEEGTFGVWFAYLATGIGANLLSYLLQPASPIVSVGASGAVFGLFAVSALVKLLRGLQWRTLLESVILGQFVVERVRDEVRNQVAGGATLAGLPVGHVAHLGGALAGVVLVLALNGLPSGDERTRR
ncbi:hypothetical protein PPROV_000235400 [Pycnococcus provasolii]|uniref:Peptidase S54 rhomboid domain-containing protein n=1 Tax=Pycnococcus provasolii TaxID=41880 RepID=A0A830HE23_9CHLO|nr:hypothetical protein PPROV_000235400 [Pycnococcus provasolii]